MLWMGLIIEWINSHAPLLTLVVLAWTLRWVRRYTRAAEKQVDASLEQVGTLQKPFLTVTWEKLTDFETSVEINMARYEKRPLRLGKVPADGFGIYNIGSGPALNISHQLKSAQNGKILKSAYASCFPHLPCKECLQTDIGRSVLNGSIVRSALDESKNVEFAIEYESLREVSYQSTVSIHREGLTEDSYQFDVKGKAISCRNGKSPASTRAATKGTAGQNSIYDMKLVSLGQPSSDFTWVITRVQMNRIPLVR